jgi:hypothetical protein
LDDRTLELLANGSPNLEDLDVSQTESSHFSEAGIRFIVKNCKELRSLVVREASNVISRGDAPSRWTPQLLLDIANNCQQLRSLGLVHLRAWLFGNQAPQAPDDEARPAIDALRLLLSRCPALSSVNLHGTVTRSSDRNPSARGGVFHVLHSAVAAAPSGLRVELATDRLPEPLRVFCGECRRCPNPPHLKAHPATEHPLNPPTEHPLNPPPVLSRMF